MSIPEQSSDVDLQTPKRLFPGRGLCCILLVLFYIFLFYGSLTPFEFNNLSIGWMEGIEQILKTAGYVESKTDWYVNLGLGIPAGFFMLGTLCLDKKSYWKWLCAIPVIIICFLFAFTVERLQLYTLHRDCTLSDILAQTLGAGIGCIVWSISGQSLWNELRKIWNESNMRGLLYVVLSLYFIAVLITTWTPFTIVYSPNDVWTRLKECLVYWIPLSEFYEGFCLYDVSIIITGTFLYMPIGIYFQYKSRLLSTDFNTTQTTLQRFQINHPFISAITFALAFSLLLTLGQVFIQSKNVYTSNILLCIVGTCIGFYTSNIRSTSVKYYVNLCLLILLLIAMVGHYWTPFNFSLTSFNNDNIWSISQLIPLADYQRSHTFTALNRLILCIEFGVATVILLRQLLGTGFRKSCFIIAICFLLFTILEGGQLFLPDRTFTLSDIILQTVISFGTLQGLSFLTKRNILSNIEPEN